MKSVFDKNLEKYGFSPNAPPAGSVEAAVTALHEPTGREAKHPNSAKKGFGRHLPNGIDGYETDRFGRPVPKLDEDAVMALRHNRRCPAWPYCDTKPYKAFFACMTHWYMLPPAMRTKVWRRSRWEIDMEELKPAVKDCVYWLHYALGPSITPERVAARAVDLLPPGEISEPSVYKAVLQACQDGTAVAHAKHAEEVFQYCWRERLEFAWY